MEKHKITQLDRIARYADLIQKQAGKAVRPYRADGYVNMMTRYGTQKDASEQYKCVPEDGVPVELLTMYYEGNGLFAKIIDTPAEDGAVFFAAGVFYYFRPEQVRALCAAMAERFPGGRLVFDAAGPTAVKLMLKTWVKQAGIRDVGAYFSVRDPARELSPWTVGIAVSSGGYMQGYQKLRGPGIRPLHRLLAQLPVGPLKLRIVRMDF